jgi:hypothetical protein
MDRPLDIDGIFDTLKSDFVYLQIDNKTVAGYDVFSISKENSTRGYFSKAMLEKIETLKTTSNDPETTEKLKQQREILDLALRYGLDAFTTEEVKQRWL